MKSANEWVEDLWSCPKGSDPDSQTQAHDVDMPALVEQIQLDAIKEGMMRTGRPCDTCGAIVPNTPPEAECPLCFQKDETQRALIELDGLRADKQLIEKLLVFVLMINAHFKPDLVEPGRSLFWKSVELKDEAHNLGYGKGHQT